MIYNLKCVIFKDFISDAYKWLDEANTWKCLLTGPPLQAYSTNYFTASIEQVTVRGEGFV